MRSLLLAGPVYEDRWKALLQQHCVNNVSQALIKMRLGPLARPDQTALSQIPAEGVVAPQPLHNLRDLRNGFWLEVQGRIPHLLPHAVTVGYRHREIGKPIQCKTLNTSQSQNLCFA
jgi:hypothetical protein